MDVLDELLHLAPAALPQAIAIGRRLETKDATFIEQTFDKINALELRIDGRLAMQFYAISPQVVIEAAIPSITPTHVWDDFVQVVVPAIQQYQVEQVRQHSDSFGQLLMNFASKMEEQGKISEVGAVYVRSINWSSPSLWMVLLSTSRLCYRGLIRRPSLTLQNRSSVHC